jgi:hypothetical protein
MEYSNSYLDFYLGMMCELHRDIAQCYSVSKRQRDAEIRLIKSRYRHEGLSFFTKALPRLGKAVDTALANGTHLSIQGFSLDGQVPKFLGYLLRRVFSACGLELDQPDPIALKHFRQFVYLLYKLEVPYGQHTEDSVVQAFKQTETDLVNLNEDSFSAEWVVQARNFVTRVVSPLDPYRIKPRHGPGSVATGEHVCDKTHFMRIYDSLERVYPFTEWMCFNLNHVADSWCDKSRVIQSVSEPTAKVVLVPKDSRGPRLISCEPLEIQWIQQGLGRALQDLIERSPYTRGHVNFACQQVNRDLALEGSRTGEWVTLDMKEASDRVSLKLVETLFEGHPLLLDALKATRSTRTKLPDGTVIPLNKFAPMGSSLCFPVESLIFYALAVSAIRHAGTPWREAMRSVYVYGDDIIVKKKDYVILMQLLPTVGLMFNSSKCCTAGFYRESCGCDAYVGVNITPSRLRTVWSHRRTEDPSGLLSYVAFYNAMYGMAHHHVAEYVKQKLNERYGNIPFTNRYVVADNGAFVSTASAAAFVCHAPAHLENVLQVRRINYALHRVEYLSYGSAPVKVKTRHDGYPEWLRRQSDDYGAYGGVYALVRRNRLKRTWMAA